MIPMTADLQDENERLRKVLNTIAQMGSVCDDFEVCRHDSCRDSCSAALLALHALGGRSMEQCVFDAHIDIGAAVAFGMMGMAQEIKNKVDEAEMVAWEARVAAQHSDMETRMQEALEEDRASWRFSK